MHNRGALSRKGLKKDGPCVSSHIWLKYVDCDLKHHWYKTMKQTVIQPIFFIYFHQMLLKYSLQPKVVSWLTQSSPSYARIIWLEQVYSTLWFSHPNYFHKTSRSLWLKGHSLHLSRAKLCSITICNSANCGLVSIKLLKCTCFLLPQGHTVISRSPAKPGCVPLIQIYSSAICGWISIKLHNCSLWPKGHTVISRSTAKHHDKASILIYNSAICGWISIKMCTSTSVLYDPKVILSRSAKHEYRYHFRYTKCMNGSCFSLSLVYEWDEVRGLRPHVRTQNQGKLPPPPPPGGLVF